MDCRFDGKVAVITGSGRGLGRAFAERFARSGADIVLTDINIPDEAVQAIEALDRQCLAVTCDVSKDDDVNRLAEKTRERFGRCDILVNNAAVFPVLTFAEMSFAQWERAYEVNIHGMFRTCKAFTQGMIDRQWGRIINIASIQFWTKTMCGPHYTSSKGAVIGLTRALSDELGPHGITVNAIAPGAIGTDTVRASLLGPQLEIAAQQRQSIRRVGMPDDLAGPAAFLASDYASFINGQTIVVDGGIFRV